MGAQSGAWKRWGPKGWGPEPRKSQGLEGLCPKGGGTNSGAPEGWGLEGCLEGWCPDGGEPKISRSFPSPASHFSLFVSLWVSSRGGVFHMAAEIVMRAEEPIVRQGSFTEDIYKS